MFGFNLGIVIGVGPYTEHHFGLSGFGLGIIVAIFELGAMTGILGTARISYRYGREKMIVCTFLFIVTAIGVAYSTGPLLPGMWRFAQGLCVGAASVLSPIVIYR